MTTKSTSSDNTPIKVLVLRPIPIYLDHCMEVQKPPVYIEIVPFNGDKVPGCVIGYVEMAELKITVASTYGIDDDSRAHALSRVHRLIVNAYLECIAEQGGDLSHINPLTTGDKSQNLK